MNVNAWGSDVIISMPVPPANHRPSLAQVGDGFSVTNGGIAHDIDLAVYEDYLVPTYAPPIPTAEGSQGG